MCLDPVKNSELACSRGAMKNFARSKTGVLKDMAAVELWLRELLGQVLPLLFFFFIILEPRVE